LNSKIEKLIFTLLILALAGIAPNLFVAAQAGYAKFSALALNVLIPSIVLIPVVMLIAYFRSHRNLLRQILVGITGGLIGTVGLEIFRHIGFLLGGMPGELPKLMGVLMLDRFAMGPNLLSNLAGWGYHFWNGASFGIIYSLIIGRGRSWMGAIYGFIIGIGFMASPAALSLGVGLFGADFGWGFPVTVILAHLAFGVLLGIVVSRKGAEGVALIGQIKSMLTER
jgi:hypothetical protein